MMPIAKIEVLRHRPPHEVAAFIDAVYQAQLEALKVPVWDKQIRYIEHKPEHFPIPPNHTENYTFIEILIFPGRSLTAKRNLYASIVLRLGELGVAASDINIALLEPPLDNWGIRGLPASEIDLGINLNV
jgi:phenylpyruvate tautomerase PptA (4-oxalocrotonate tautomerase family)